MTPRLWAHSGTSCLVDSVAASALSPSFSTSPSPVHSRHFYCSVSSFNPDFHQVSSRANPQVTLNETFSDPTEFPSGSRPRGSGIRGAEPELPLPTLGPLCLGLSPGLRPGERRGQCPRARPGESPPFGHTALAQLCLQTGFPSAHVFLGLRSCAEGPRNM